MNDEGVKNVPQLITKSNNYYIYEYIDGDLMNNIFSTLSEKEKVAICHDVACFHFELSQITKEKALSLGVKEYKPEKNKLGLEQHDFGNLNKEEISVINEAHKIYIDSLDDSLPQLLHNDAHDKNILISKKKGVFIDFGDMIWRDVHYDFYRYVFDYPGYWEIIVSEFEKLSGKKLNRKRIVVVSFLRHLRGLIEGGDVKGVVSEKIAYYSNLIKSSI